MCFYTAAFCSVRTSNIPLFKGKGPNFLSLSAPKQHVSTTCDNIYMCIITCPGSKTNQSTHTPPSCTVYHVCVHFPVYLCQPSHSHAPHDWAGVTVISCPTPISFPLFPFAATQVKPIQQPLLSYSSLTSFKDDFLMQIMKTFFPLSVYSPIFYSYKTISWSVFPVYVIKKRLKPTVTF